MFVYMYASFCPFEGEIKSRMHCQASASQLLFLFVFCATFVYQQERTLLSDLFRDLNL